MNNKKKLCKILCGKDSCPVDVYKCNGYMLKKCKENGMSYIENLNRNQLAYIMSDINADIFLKACPGSGKTEVLGIKSAYEIKTWSEKYQGIAILTFTNSAEDEIRDRVETYLNETIKYPNYLGTFTSWIHGYIANPFLSKITGYKGDGNNNKSIKLIEGGSDSDFLNIFSSKYGYRELGNIKPQEYYLDFKTDQFIYCGNRSREGQNVLEQLIYENAWRVVDLEKVKEKFWKKGLCLYEDVEYLVFLLLDEYKEIAKFLSKRFPIILVDECQDLSYVQLEILRLLHGQGCKIHLIGDLDQAIYAFRKIEPSDTIDFIKELEFIEMQLNQNYRSCQDIVDISDFIINRNSNIKGGVPQIVSKPLVVILYKKDKERDAVKAFDNLVKANDFCIQNSRVIVRNNTLKNKLLGLKNQGESNNLLEDLVRAIYLTQKGRGISELKASFLLFSKSIRKVYFKDSEHLGSNYFYKPKEFEIKEWKELIIRIKNILMEQSGLLDLKKTWTEWKKILDNVLNKSISEISMLSGKEYDLGRIRSGNTKKTIEEVLFLNNNCMLEYKIETIHGCKGMSLDAVLLISSYQAGKDKDSGAYWRQWFDRNIIDEKNRLAYVAFSRAKHLLALGIPKPSTFTNEDRNILQKQGFNIMEV